MSEVSGNNNVNQIVTVRPRNVALFKAACWRSDKDDTAVRELVEQAGWAVESLEFSLGTGSTLRLVRQLRSPIRVRDGDWLVMLGTSGSLRVMSDKQFKYTYEAV